MTIRRNVLAAPTFSLLPQVALRISENNSTFASFANSKYKREGTAAQIVFSFLFFSYTKSWHGMLGSDQLKLWGRPWKYYVAGIIRSLCFFIVAISYKMDCVFENEVPKKTWPNNVRGVYQQYKGVC